MAIINNKQRLFEVMRKVNKDFKPKLNEVSNEKFRLVESVGKSKTFSLNLWGEDEELYFEFNQYGNGALAVQLMSPMEGPYATVSTNLPESTELPKDEFFMKSWSENEELANELIRKGIVQATGKEASTGFVSAKSYKLNPIYTNSGIGNVGVNETAQDINSQYTHFAVTKDTDEIVNGWDYGDIEPVELRQFKKDYFFDDLTGMEIDPHNIKIVTTKYLQNSGINPFDINSWKR